MIFISHRGNITGPSPEHENKVGYIEEAIRKSYEVEIDVWWYENDWWLGHDKPQYKTTLNFLKQDGMWCHAKNTDALKRMLQKNVHCFWHQEDKVTLTSLNHIWAYPGYQPIKDSIAVMPELCNDEIFCCKGVCSDFIERYRDDFYEMVYG